MTARPTSTSRAGSILDRIEPLFRLLCMLAALIVPRLVAAATLDATWTGGSDTWSTASRWSGGASPNNGVDTFNVFIDGGKPDASDVQLDVSATIDSLHIDAGATDPVCG